MFCLVLQPVQESGLKFYLVLPRTGAKEKGFVPVDLVLAERVSRSGAYIGAGVGSAICRASCHQPKSFTVSTVFMKSEVGCAQIASSVRTRHELQVQSCNLPEAISQSILAGFCHCIPTEDHCFVPAAQRTRSSLGN